MYETLFNIAGPAILAWLLMIFAPKWRVTQWLVRSAIVPALLAVLYVIGIALLIGENGMGFMRDFGSAEGVTGLMARPEIALVAWIHFLVFDQLVGIFIFRDNMHHRYVPIPVQSVILFLTLMLGPVGFLSYYLIRWARSGSPGGRTAADAGVTEAVASGAKLGSLPLAEIIRRGWRRMMETPALVVMGFVGIGLGLICLAVMAARGRRAHPARRRSEQAGNLRHCRRHLYPDDHAPPSVGGFLGARQEALGAAGMSGSSPTPTSSRRCRHSAVSTHASPSMGPHWTRSREECSSSPRSESWCCSSSWLVRFFRRGSTRCRLSNSYSPSDTVRAAAIGRFRRWNLDERDRRQNHGSLLETFFRCTRWDFTGFRQFRSSRFCSFGPATIAARRGNGFTRPESSGWRRARRWRGRP